MTRLLPLSVQRILKNLNKIRGEVFHAGKGSVHALNEVGKPFCLRGSCGMSRGSGKRRPKKNEQEKMGHIVEITPSEQDRSMRLDPAHGGC